MTTLFCVRPSTRNIGNDIINLAVVDLLYGTFGEDTGIVNIPALQGLQFGGFTARQVHDMNQAADGVVLGGGNLFENGQLTVEAQAIEALRVPLLIIWLSHGRIFGRDGELWDRTDSMDPDTIRLLSSKPVTLLDHPPLSGPLAMLVQKGLEGTLVNFMSARDNPVSALGHKRT